MPCITEFYELLDSEVDSEDKYGHFVINHKTKWEN